MVRPSSSTVAPALVAALLATLVAGCASEPEAAGAWDPVAALVFCGPTRVRDLFVEGRQVVRDGHLATIDLPHVIEDQARLARRLMG